MEDLEAMAAQLLAAVRCMPPGQKRQDALREIGILRNRMHALLRQVPPVQAQQPTASSKSARTRPNAAKLDHRRLTSKK
jgi:hypothetical protein